MCGLRPNKRKAFNIISNYRHYGAGLHVMQHFGRLSTGVRNGGQRFSGWPVRIIVIMLLAVAAGIFWRLIIFAQYLP